MNTKVSQNNTRLYPVPGAGILSTPLCFSVFHSFLLLNPPGAAHYTDFVPDTQFEKHWLRGAQRRAAQLLK